MSRVLELLLLLSVWPYVSGYHLAHRGDSNSCATILCPTGHDCVVIDGRAQCAAVSSTNCGSTTCADSLEAQPRQPCNEGECAVTGPQCGSATCKVGTECCNPSCSVCTPPGVACLMMVCN